MLEVTGIKEEREERKRKREEGGENQIHQVLVSVLGIPH